MEVTPFPTALQVKTAALAVTSPRQVAVQVLPETQAVVDNKDTAVIAPPTTTYQEEMGPMGFIKGWEEPPGAVEAGAGAVKAVLPMAKFQAGVEAAQFARMALVHGARTVESLFTTLISQSSGRKKAPDMKRVFLVLLFSGAAIGQSSNRFNISGGVIFSSSSRFQVGSTIGQPLASPPGSSRFSIRSGFWIWPAPIISAATRTGTNFVFSFETEMGKSYVVESTDSLTAPVWQSLPAILGDGTIKTVTAPAVGTSQRFYRVREF